MLLIFLNLAFICHYGSGQLITPTNYLDLIEQIVTIIEPFQASASDVTFYGASQSQPDPVLITSENAALIDVTKQTKFIIHGYLQGYQGSWIQDIKNEYLSTYNVNIIMVDWSKPARTGYPYAAASVDVVGKTVAQFILDRGLTPGNVHIIGHSLGAQVGGFAGQYLIAGGYTLGRITGLDPAGPLFRDPTKTDADRLSKDDAAIVDAVHTDAKFFGYENLVGTLDIYVNNGTRDQPPCIENLLTSPTTNFLSDATCSHSMAHTYFTESVNEGKYQCKFCDPLLETFIYGGVCTDNGKQASLGAEDITESTTGICFATTKNTEPYLS